MYRLCIAAFLLCLAIGGCSSVDPAASCSAASLNDKLALVMNSVVAIESTAEEFRASAVSLGGNRFLTNRHCLPAAAFSAVGSGEELTIAGNVVAVKPTFELLLNGTSVSAVLDDRGASEAAEDDWAIFQVVGPDLGVPALVQKPKYQPEADAEIFLVGFWGNRKGRDAAVITGRVTTPPFPWLDLPEEIIPLDTSYDEVYFGLSGGAAVVWDESHGGYVLVGIYRGMRQWPLVFGLKLGVQAVRRLPEQLD